MTSKESGQFTIYIGKDVVHNPNSERNRFTSAISRIVNDDGEDVVLIDHRKEHGSYAVFWRNYKITANEFFTKAQKLKELVRELDGSFTFEGKLLEGLDYFSPDSHPVEISMSDFEPVEDLDYNDVQAARFSTPYIDFIWKRPAEDFDPGLNLGLITHLHAPELIGQFVRDNSGWTIDNEALSMLLNTVGLSASQTMRELNSQRVIK